jgi:hypothetical protein
LIVIGITNIQWPDQKVTDGYAFDKCNYGEKAGGATGSQVQTPVISIQCLIGYANKTPVE